MSRIFDALRKASAGRPEPLAPLPAMTPAPPPPAATPARPAPPRASDRGTGTGRGYPLALGVDLDDDIVQQMTTLRVGLESFLADRACRVIAFQSPQGGEGATTVAHQFAWTLARDRSLHTLLIDANAARPTIEIDPARRIASCRVSPAGPPGGLEPGVAINLHALPVPDEIRRAGVFSPAEARELVETETGAYDWVILDAPPVLDSSDAPPLASVADAVVVVVQAGRTKKPVLARTVDLLRKAGARVAGTVLNRRQLEIPEFIYRRL
jgi:protein-tyrosine kinase